MPKDNRFFAVSIRKYLEAGNDREAGEQALVEMLSGFSCPKNLDVERFLIKNAVEFTKKEQSITYVVLSSEDLSLLGYFTLAIKPLTVRGKTVSNQTRKKIARISELDEKSDSYNMAAYLIAQLGKNFAVDEGKGITGAELLELAWDKVKEAQYIAGGVVAFLEAEPHPELLTFYEANGFKQFDTRQTKGMAEQHELIQLLRLL